MILTAQMVCHYEIVAEIENLKTLRTEVCLRIWLTTADGTPGGLRLCEDRYSIMVMP